MICVAPAPARETRGAIASQTSQQKRPGALNPKEYANHRIGQNFARKSGGRERFDETAPGLPTGDPVTL
jgi:hypothetical protein